jgi:hypothetical protein
MELDSRRLEEENRRLKRAVERLSETVRAQRAQINERVPVRLDTHLARDGVLDTLRSAIEAHLSQHRGLILADQVEELTLRILSGLKDLNRAYRDGADADGPAADADGSEDDELEAA